ncbi:hypothetical protein OC834_005424 [Tilletia horrida]|nr:hypothetical protein OC834_005424 [Tilletia horrida]
MSHGEIFDRVRDQYYTAIEEAVAAEAPAVAGRAVVDQMMSTLRIHVSTQWQKEDEVKVLQAKLGDAEEEIKILRAQKATVQDELTDFKAAHEAKVKGAVESAEQCAKDLRADLRREQETSQRFVSFLSNRKKGKEEELEKVSAQLRTTRSDLESAKEINSALHKQLHDAMALASQSSGNSENGGTRPAAAVASSLMAAPAPSVIKASRTDQEWRTRYNNTKNDLQAKIEEEKQKRRDKVDALQERINELERQHKVDKDSIAYFEEQVYDQNGISERRIMQRLQRELWDMQLQRERFESARRHAVDEQHRLQVEGLTKRIERLRGFVPYREVTDSPDSTSSREDTDEDEELENIPPGPSTASQQASTNPGATSTALPASPVVSTEFRESAGRDQSATDVDQQAQRHKRDTDDEVQFTHAKMKKVKTTKV